MKRIFSILFALVLAVSLMLVPAASVGADPGPGLVGLWHLDGDAADSSGNGHDGAVTGTPTWPGDQWTGQALGCDGDDYVDVGASVDDTISTGVTLEAWINPAVEQWGGIISNDATYNTNQGYDFFLWDDSWFGGVYGQLFIDFGNGSTLGRTYWNIPSAAWYNQWHHVAATWDGSNITLYVDSSQVSVLAYSGSYSDPGKSTFIGAINSGGPVWHFNGLIDEVRIWDTATRSFNLDATPATDVNPVMTDHTVTATVTINKATTGVEVAPGEKVNFDITGPNSSESGYAYTQSNGVATFTYTGSGGGGTDTINAWIDQDWSGDFNSANDAWDEVTKDWLEHYVTGGGLIETGKGKDAAKITFGGNVGFDLSGNVVGQWQVNFHNVNEDTIDNSKFHTTSFSELNFTYCNQHDVWRASFIATGRFNGEEDWSMNVRLADFGNPGIGNDSIRIILCNPDNPYNPDTIKYLKYAVYDTWEQKGVWGLPDYPPYDSQYGWKGDFPDEESPFWPDGGWTHSVRTKLDGGNIQIHPPDLP